VLHVYLSMVCFAVVLFFSVTGLTLNHPTWTLGDGAELTEKGTLPAGWIGSDGAIDWLTTAEYLRAEHSLKGSVSDREATAADASITFKGPGYGADAFIDAATGNYTIAVAQQGPLGGAPPAAR
jgi:uncharacterized protein